MKFFLSIFIASLPSQGGVAEFQADDGHQRDGYYGWVGCGGSQNLTTDSPVLPFKHFIFVFECITGGWVTVAACSSGIQDSTLGLPLPQPDDLCYSYLYFCADHLYFTSQITKKYSIVLC